MVIAGCGPAPCGRNSHAPSMMPPSAGKVTSIFETIHGLPIPVTVLCTYMDVSAPLATTAPKISWGTNDAESRGMTAPVIIVGHNMGAPVAERAAVARPDAMAAIVLLTRWA